MPNETSGIPLPIGYSQDTLQNYYKSLVNPISMDTQSQVGSVKTDAAARGLEGTPTETGGVAAANYFGGMRKDQALGGLALNMAGLSNQDALIKQQQDWQSGENKLGRAEQEKLANMGYNFDYGMENTQNRHAYQAAPWQIAAGIGGAAMGGWAAGGFK